jgi:hypothetical protein
MQLIRSYCSGQPLGLCDLLGRHMLGDLIAIPKLIRIILFPVVTCCNGKPIYFCANDRGGNVIPFVGLSIIRGGAPTAIPIQISQLHLR